MTNPNPVETVERTDPRTQQVDNLRLCKTIFGKNSEEYYNMKIASSRQQSNKSRPSTKNSIIKKGSLGSL